MINTIKIIKLTIIKNIKTMTNTIKKIEIIFKIWIITIKIMMTEMITHIRKIIKRAVWNLNFRISREIKDQNIQNLGNGIKYMLKNKIQKQIFLTRL